jgi:DNA-binding CsgD family transcriptional regulator
MTSSPSAADLRAVLSFADATLAVEDFAQLPSGLLGRLAELVGSDAATLTHLDLRTQREVSVLWPPSRATVGLLEPYARQGAGHPLRGPVGRAVRTGRLDGPAMRISDLLSRRQWRQTPLYQETLRDVDDQMCLPLAASGTTVHAVTLARAGRPFSDRQRDLLTSCRGHLASAVRRARRDGRVALQIAPSVGWVDAGAAPGLARHAQPARPMGALSGREREVLALVATGLTDAQVARHLRLSPATISKHLHRIYTRLGIPNRVAAVQIWTQGR